MHPLIHDIWRLVGSCTSTDIRHVYHEDNKIADWIASYVTEHTGKIVWIEMADLSLAFDDVLLSDLFGCIHTRIVSVLQLITKKKKKMFLVKTR